MKYNFGSHAACLIAFGFNNIPDAKQAIQKLANDEKPIGKASEIYVWGRKELNSIETIVAITDKGFDSDLTFELNKNSLLLKFSIYNFALGNKKAISDERIQFLYYKTIERAKKATDFNDLREIIIDARKKIVEIDSAYTPIWVDFYAQYQSTYKDTQKEYTSRHQISPEIDKNFKIDDIELSK